MTRETTREDVQDIGQLTDRHGAQQSAPPAQRGKEDFTQRDGPRPNGAEGLALNGGNTYNLVTFHIFLEI